MAGIPDPTTVPYSQLRITEGDPSPYGTPWTPLDGLNLARGDPNVQALAESADYTVDVNSFADMGRVIQFMPDPLASQADYQAAGSELWRIEIWGAPPPSYPGTAHFRVIHVHSQALGPFFEFLTFFIRAALIVGVVVIVLLHWQTVLQALKDFINTSVTSITSPIINAWVEVALIAAGLGMAVWLIESKIARGQGERVAPPPVGSLTPAPPPTFSITGGASARGGPVAAGYGVSAGPADSLPAPSYPSPPPPRERGSFGSHYGGGSRPRESRAVRRAESRASLAAANRRETEERAHEERIRRERKSARRPARGSFA